MKFHRSPLLLLLGTLSAPLHAQVIEIDSSGEARTYAGPTIFTSDEVIAIVPEEASSARPVNSAAVFADTARKHGLEPGLLEAVAWQESRGRMDAVSSKGARGVMQLMPGTAAELGVVSSDFADNVRGGAIYLKRQLDRFGSVSLALAAYNAGPGAVIRYRGIPPYRETQNYVAKILGRWRPSSVTRPFNHLLIEVPKL